MHRHQHTTWVCVPPQNVLKEALHAYDALPYRFSSPDPQLPVADQLVINMHAYDEVTPSPLGRPLRLEAGLQIIEHTLTIMEHEHTPSPVCVPQEGSLPPVEDAILIHDDVPRVYTSTGWRPIAGGFKYLLRTWHQYKQHLDPWVLGVITRGAWLDWQTAPPPPLWLANHRLSGRESDFVAQEISALHLTRAIVPYDIRVHGVPKFIGPLHVATDSSGKMRLVWDPRYLNAFLRQKSVKLETLDSLQLYVERCSAILKIDLKSGYHHLLLREEYAPYLCFTWDGRIWTWRALAFGLSLAPFIFEMTMRNLKRIFRAVFHQRMLGYLDDFGTVFPPPDIVLSVKELLGFLRQGTDIPKAAEGPIQMLRLFIAFGGTLNVPKLAYGQLVELLGILVDTERERFSIPARRMESLRTSLQAMVEQEKLPVREMACTSGKLISMETGMKHAKILLWSLFHYIEPFAQRNQWHRKITIAPEVRQRCQFWLRHLDEFNGIDMRREPDTAVEWDAAKAGSGMLAYGPGLMEIIHADRPLSEQAGHSNDWELWACIDLILTVLDQLRGRRLVLRSDNMFTVSYLKRGGGHRRDCTKLVQALHEVFIVYHIDVIRVEHIPGVLNVFPDALSRYQDAQGDWAITPEALAGVRCWIHSQGLPQFNVDAMASQLNHVTPTFCSRFREPGCSYVNFFTTDFRAADTVLWVNPPFSLMLRTLLHLQQAASCAYVVAPRKPEHPWWLPLATMASHVHTLPPMAFTSILTAHTAGFHPPTYAIDVFFITLPLHSHPPRQA